MNNAEVEPEQPDPRLTAIAALCERAAQQGLIGFPDQVREALAGVQPVTLDRAAAREAIHNAHPADWTPSERWIEDLLDRLAACVAPVDGVLLTLDEAARVRSWYQVMDDDATPEAAATDRALAARLEREAGA